MNLHLKEDCDWFANSANGVLCVAGPLDRRGGSFKYRSLDRSQKVTTWLIDSQGAQAWNKGWLLVIIGRSICRVLTYLLFFTFFCTMHSFMVVNLDQLAEFRHWICSQRVADSTLALCSD